jgi:hypothetical protein
MVVTFVPIQVVSRLVETYRRRTEDGWVGAPEVFVTGTGLDGRACGGGAPGNRLPPVTPLKPEAELYDRRTAVSSTLSYCGRFFRLTNGHSG